jgi:hypothetical protein
MGMHMKNDNNLLLDLKWDVLPKDITSYKTGRTISFG